MPERLAEGCLLSRRDYHFDYHSAKVPFYGYKIQEEDSQGKRRGFNL